YATIQWLTIYINESGIARTIPLDLDVIGNVPENSSCFKTIPIFWDHRVHRQAMVSRFDSKNILRDGNIIPTGCACQPGVFRFAMGGRFLAGNGLGIDIRFTAVNLTDR